MKTGTNEMKSTPVMRSRTLLTSSLAVAERPRDASCHWIFC